MYLPIKLLPKTVINSHKVFFTILIEDQICSDHEDILCAC